MKLILMIIDWVDLVGKAALWAIEKALWAVEKWHSFCEKSVLQEEADYFFMAEQVRKEERVLYLDPVKQGAQSRSE